MSTEIVVATIIILLIAYLISIYNKLISLRNRFRNGFAQIDVQLKRRYELIPNLVETARAYMEHERETLSAVIEARNSAAKAAKSARRDPGDAAAMHRLVGAEAGLGSALGGFFALAENYPELKANTTMSQLMEELSSTENRVAFARQAFNDAVMDYNTQRELFPNNMVSSFFEFAEAESFEIEDAEIREPVEVSFG